MIATRRCPVCKRQRVPVFAPFCSQACRDRDLLQWLNDGYALPGPPAELAEDAPAPPADAEDV